MSELLQFLAQHPWQSWFLLALILGIPGAILKRAVMGLCDFECPRCRGLGRVSKT